MKRIIIIHYKHIDYSPLTPHAKPFVPKQPHTSAESPDAFYTRINTLRHHPSPPLIQLEKEISHRLKTHPNTLEQPLKVGMSDVGRKYKSIKRK